MRKKQLLIPLLLLGLLDVGAQSSAIVFSFEAENYPGSEIVGSLLDGHRSEVHYEFRVLRKAKGLLKLFGDRLIKEEELLYVARWDAFDETFVVLVDESVERVFTNAGAFLDFFLSVDNYRMGLPGGFEDEDYLLCRWRIQPIKLVPPLTLMTLIKSDLQTISSWQQTEVERVIR